MLTPLISNYDNSEGVITTHTIGSDILNHLKDYIEYIFFDHLGRMCEPWAEFVGAGPSSSLDRVHWQGAGRFGARRFRRMSISAHAKTTGFLLKIKLIRRRKSRQLGAILSDKTKSFQFQK